jgi:tetratricopeptide (TPR) repeat protein
VRKKATRRLAVGEKSSSLVERAEKALREGRLTQAVELATTLFRSDPNPAHRNLLLKATFEQIGLFTASQRTGTALALAISLLPLVETPEDQVRLAVIFARCGDLGKAQEAASTATHPAVQPKLLGHVADAAIRGLPVTTNGLPADFNVQKDAVVRAFAAAEAGDDEKARTELQIIGLSSPFLEWKLLLRGLLAFWTNDDPRAVENWQRLDPERSPARVAAPFRASIDAAFRDAQPPATRNRLLADQDRFQVAGAVPRLRALVPLLANETQLPQAFRAVESLLPALKAEKPELAKRLAAVFFWVVVHHGYEEDSKRYKRIFGAPPEDPNLTRLAAIAHESSGHPAQAYNFWRQYERSVADHAASFPPGRADQIRALIWRRLGGIAAHLSDERDPLDFFAPLVEIKTNQVDRDAETCFRRAIELAPDQLTGYNELLHYLIPEGDPAKTLGAAQALLERFPGHLPALEAAADVSLRQQDYANAVKYLTEAVKVNAIDTDVRGNLGIAHLGLAIQHAAAKSYPQARGSFRAGLVLCESIWKLFGLCHWSLTERKAGDAARADELLQEARQLNTAPLAVALAFAIAAIQVKSPPKLKKQFADEFKNLLEQQPLNPRAVSEIVVLITLLRMRSIRYTGQQKHEKLLLDLLKKADGKSFPEPLLEKICAAMLTLQANMSAYRKWCGLGQARFPQNPAFYIIEVQCEVAKPSGRPDLFRCRRLLSKARELAEKLQGERREGFLEMVKSLESVFGPAGLSPFDFPFGGFGKQGGGFFPDDDFDDDNDF